MSYFLIKGHFFIIASMMKQQTKDILRKWELMQITQWRENYFGFIHMQKHFLKCVSKINILKLQFGQQLQNKTQQEF